MMGTDQANGGPGGRRRSSAGLLLSGRVRRRQRIVAAIGNGFLVAVTSLSILAVLFIFVFIARDAIPFFKTEGIREFFSSTRWYPSRSPAEFGALAIFVGSFIVAAGAAVVAVPLGVAAAVCLSDVLPFSLRQVVKPVIEMLAAIPSVAYGFFALVVLAPYLQREGGHVLAVAAWVVGLPLLILAALVLGDVTADRWADRWSGVREPLVRWGIAGALTAVGVYGLWVLGGILGRVAIVSGTNALNVSIILGIMALPTVVSVSEDALQAVGRDWREGSYALGATRAETLVRVIIPAASSGIAAAVILGVMRAIGETMVVWMASGNASQIPKPWYNVLQPVRTLTATIAGDMGEADHVASSMRYSVLFAMAFSLLAISFVCNVASERIMLRSRKRLAAG